LFSNIPFQKGIDYIGYATGQTDKFQGTGVFSGIKMERKPSSSEAVAETKAESSSKDGKAITQTTDITDSK
jgi:hypothetical protein